MGEALPRQDDALADRCAFAVMLARTRVGFGGSPKDSSFLQGLRFNGDGTTFNPFGTVNIGSTIIIDATGGVGTYTVAPDYTGTLSIPTGPNFNIFGPGAQQVWTTQIAGGASVGTAYECRSKSSSAVATRFDLSPITGFGAVYPRQTHSLIKDLLKILCGAEL